MLSTRTAAGPQANRERIIEAAAKLLTEGGRDAVSTRTVCAAAGVQAPTMYRLFGDKHGLLDAVAADGFAKYVAAESRRGLSSDPVEDLRAGWDLHVGFGLANPALYSIIYGDPHPGLLPPAAAASLEILGTLIHRVAEVGRLRVSEDRATQLMYSAGGGTTLTLIAVPQERRDLALSHAAREAIIAAIITDAPAATAPGPVGAAVALRAVLPQTQELTSREEGLLTEWLDRIADPGRGDSLRHEQS